MTHGETTFDRTIRVKRVNHEQILLGLVRALDHPEETPMLLECLRSCGFRTQKVGRAVFAKAGLDTTQRYVAA